MASLVSGDDSNDTQSAKASKEKRAVWTQEEKDWITERISASGAGLLLKTASDLKSAADKAKREYDLNRIYAEFVSSGVQSRTWKVSSFRSLLKNLKQRGAALRTKGRREATATGGGPSFNFSSAEQCLVDLTGDKAEPVVNVNDSDAGFGDEIATPVECLNISKRKGEIYLAGGKEEWLNINKRKRENHSASRTLFSLPLSLPSLVSLPSSSLLLSVA